MTPPPARRTRHPLLLGGALVAGVAVVVGATLLVSHVVTPTAAPVPATVPAVLPTTDEAAPTTTTEDPQARQVDAAVAMDGTTIDWASVGTDAYHWTGLVCAYLTDYPGGPTAVNWYQITIPGVMTRGGMTALKTAVPYVCPQYTKLINLAANSFFPGS